VRGGHVPLSSLLPTPGPLLASTTLAWGETSTKANTRFERGQAGIKDPHL